MNSDEQQTILVVDDEPANIQALGSLLKDEYRIRVANSGEKALTMLQDGAQPHPDLILLDVKMPGIDGYEVCRRIKEDPNSSDIPVIFVTAMNAAGDEEQGLNLGAVDYIAKPFNRAIVRARVHTHMSLKRKTDLLEQIALLDGLTGIPNRRYFDEQLQREANRSLRQEKSLSVLMMDIDHFKDFNDHYGHGAGDQCLQKVAETLKTTLLRPADMIARYGGEEFVALLPGTDASGAREVAEKLRTAIAELAIPHEHSSASSVVTLSIGCATYSPQDPEEVLDGLLKSGDEALYSAKKTGRNRCACDVR